MGTLVCANLSLFNRSYWKSSSDAASLKAGVLARASLEATSLTLKVGFSEMGLKELDQIVVSGGGSGNTLWPQIIADVFGVPVAKPQNADEAATRAVTTALASSGH